MVEEIGLVEEVVEERRGLEVEIDQEEIWLEGEVEKGLDGEKVVGEGEENGLAGPFGEECVEKGLVRLSWGGSPSALGTPPFNNGDEETLDNSAFGGFGSVCNQKKMTNMF